MGWGRRKVSVSCERALCRLRVALQCVVTAFTVSNRRKEIALRTPVREFILSTNMWYALKLPFCRLRIFRCCVYLAFIRNVWVIAALPVVSPSASSSVCSRLLCVLEPGGLTWSFFGYYVRIWLVQRNRDWDMGISSWNVVGGKGCPFPLPCLTELSGFFCGFVCCSSCDLLRQLKERTNIDYLNICLCLTEGLLHCNALWF